MKVIYVPCELGTEGEGLLTINGSILTKELEEFERAAKGEVIEGYTVKDSVVTKQYSVTSETLTFSEISELSEMLKLAKAANVNYRLIWQDGVGNTANTRIGICRISDNYAMVVDLNSFELYTVTNSAVISKLFSNINKELSKAECEELLSEVIKCS